MAYGLLTSSNFSHDVSTQLESLYLSMRSIAVGSLPYDWVFNQFSRTWQWAEAMRGSMTRQQGFPHVSAEVAAFLHDLHQLFWPQADVEGQLFYGYRSDVSTEEFLDVCRRHGAYG